MLNVCLLDSYAGQLALVKDVTTQYQTWKQAQTALYTLRAQDNTARGELLRYQVQELRDNLALGDLMN